MKVLNTGLCFYLLLRLIAQRHAQMHAEVLHTNNWRTEHQWC